MSSHLSPRINATPWIFSEQFHHHSSYSLFVPSFAADDCANAVVMGTPCRKNARCVRNGGAYDCVCDGTWTWGDAGNATCIGRYLRTAGRCRAGIHARTVCMRQVHVHTPTNEHTVCGAWLPNSAAKHLVRMRRCCLPADLDECKSPGSNNCSVHATCINVPDGGGYNCSCDAGYTGEAYGGTCVGACLPRMLWGWRPRAGLPQTDVCAAATWHVVYACLRPPLSTQPCHHGFPASNQTPTADVAIAGTPLLEATAGSPAQLAFTGAFCIVFSCSADWSIECPGKPTIKKTGAVVSISTGAGPGVDISTWGLTSSINCTVSLLASALSSGNGSAAASLLVSAAGAVAWLCVGSLGIPWTEPHNQACQPSPGRTCRAQHVGAAGRQRHQHATMLLLASELAPNGCSTPCSLPPCLP